MITIIGRNGEQRTVEGRDGWSVMEIIRSAGFHELLATCGGNCSCATCHVYVEHGLRGDRGGDENDLLEFSDHHSERSRLACQIRYGPALSGLTVRIAPED